MSPTGQGLSIAVSTTAAMTAAAVLLFVFIQLDRTRLQLQGDGVLEFNFVQQTDHNLDEFAYALETARRHRADLPGGDADSWIERYDVLFSVVSGTQRWAGSLLHDERTRSVFARLHAFVMSIEPLMVAEKLPDDDRLQAIGDEARGLSHEIYNSGLLLFKRKAALRDSIALRMDRLTQLAWFFGALFLLAGLSLYLLMARAIHLAAQLTDEARSTHEQLETALAEVTTGDSHRTSQNRFLAAATHDLRQPLQALQYYLTALQAHVPGDTGRDILASVGRSADAAQSMLTTLLDMSRLDAGALVPAPRALDLDALLRRLYEDYRVEADERGLTLAIEDCGYWVFSDPQLLERVLRNLISNALAYTHEGGVSITSTSDDGTLSLIVEDTGIGIANRELEAIFNEYYRSGSALRDDSAGAGLGLGLSIVRRLTRLLDVTVRVRSTEGRGTRFELDLPMAAADPVVDASPAVSGTNGAAIVRGLAILVIDDESAVREGVAVLLRQQGCKVIAAADADDACRQLVDAGVVPDLILADLQLLGGRDGVDAIETVREEVNESVPAIIITGDTAPSRLQDARRIGVPLLHKPVLPTELFQCIASTLDPNRATDDAEPGSAS